MLAMKSTARQADEAYRKEAFEELFAPEIKKNISVICTRETEAGY